MNYQNIKLDKAMYNSEIGFSAHLEQLDPSITYSFNSIGMDSLDAYERQLKRFDIKVSGKNIDQVSKFFTNDQTAILFPEFVRRSVTSGMKNNDTANIKDIIAATTYTNSYDYRSITISGNPIEYSEDETVENSNKVFITLNENLVKLKKRGRLLYCKFDEIKYQPIDIFKIALSQIGGYITKSQFKDVADLILDHSEDIVKRAFTGKLSYTLLLNLWKEFQEFEMNTMLVSPDMALSIASIPEIIQSGDTNKPFGVKIIKSSAIPSGTIIALDSRFALQMVTEKEISLEYDKLINSQLERVAITSTYGFSKLFPEAIKVLKLE